MSIPSSDVPPEEEFGATLEQFRQALTTELGRKNLGIDISDEDAAAVAADAEQSGRWYEVWQTSVREQPSAAVDELAPAGLKHARKQQGDWQRHLPVRFNPPPGWSVPRQDWILQHIGLEMCDAWRPPGAPTYDPPDWMWWVPQEPAWTAWIEQHKPAARRAQGFGAALVVFVGLAVAVPFAGWALGGLLAVLCAIASGIGLGLAIASLRHFRRDPLGELRDNHTQIAERLKYGATVADGHFIDFADFADFFDGE